MNGLKEVHYRGLSKCPARIVGYYQGKPNQNETNIGLLVMHYKRDAEKYDQDVTKLASFEAKMQGLSGVRLNGKLFIVFNFTYVRTIMLLNNGYGSPACFDNGVANACSLDWISYRGVTYREDMMSYDASAGFVTTEALEKLALDESEAQCIYNAMEHYENGKASYNPVSCEEGVEEERPLWNAQKAFLANLVSASA